MTYHICYAYSDYESDIEEYRLNDVKEHYYLFGEIDLFESLNDEVEIIEEDNKIEIISKLPMLEWDDFDTKLAINQTRRKINELIDEVNKLKEGK